MPRLLFIVFFILFSLHSQAQENSPTIICNHVKVIDEVTRKLLKNADFTAFNTHGRQIKNILCLENNTVIDKVEHFNGYTLIMEEFVDTLILRAAIPDHEPAEAIVPLPREKYQEAKDNRFFWDDEIPLYTRRSMQIDLGEAEVRASRILMVQKGDTIIYNAAALQMSSGSMLSSLIHALPGVQLENGGRITVNGEYVERLLVNGKDFFKGDANVALDNLPYYTVDRVKVYHQGMPELQNATHADSLHAMAFKPILTMDVRLKKEYGQGWLANFETALGLRTSGKSGTVHRGRAFALRFTDHSSLGIYASANNVGDNHNPTHNGEWREMAAGGEGEMTAQKGGIDFSIENKEQTVKFATTLDAGHSTADTERLTSEQMAYSTSDIFGRSRLSQHDVSGNINWKATLTKSKRKKYSFSLSPKFSFRKNISDSRSLSASFDDDPLDATRTASLDSLFQPPHSMRLQQMLICSTQMAGSSEYHWLQTGLSALAGIFLPFTGQNLNLSAGIDYSERNQEDLHFRNVTSHSTGGYDENAHSRSLSDVWSWNACVSHQLFLWSGKPGWFQGVLSYGFNRKSEAEEERLRKNALSILSGLSADANLSLSYWGAMPGNFWLPDLPNSFTTTTTVDAHSLSLDLSSIIGINPAKSYNFSATLPLHILSRHMTDERNAFVHNMSKQDVYFSPSMSVSHANFSISYHLRTRLPELSQLLDVTENGFSLFVRKGNPNLQTAYTHELSFRYQHKRTEYSEWLNINAQANFVQHEVKNALTYDRSTGVTVLQPCNTDGNSLAAASVGFGRALDKEKLLNFSLKSDYSFARITGFSTDVLAALPEQMAIFNHTIREELTLSFRHRQMRLGLKGRFVWNDADSDRTAFGHLRYHDHAYTLSFAAPLFPGIGNDRWTIDFDTDLNLNLCRGYHEPTMNITEWVWNAALSTRLGKKKLWVVRAVGFDLLRQLSNITRTLTAQGLRETWANTTRSYVSLHIICHLEIKPKKGIGEM